MVRTMRALLILLVPLLGCEFFSPGNTDPDPLLDGALRCGEGEDVTDWLTGQRVAIDVERGVDFEITLSLSRPNHGGRLLLESEFETIRQLEIWEGSTGRRVIPGQRVDGGTPFLELIALDGQPLLGTATMTCADVAEDCRDLIDNDQDGLVDCADLACAQHPECIEDQEPLEEVVIDCGEQLTPAPPLLQAFDDQVVLYGTRPGGDDAPWWAWWGGAEVAVLPSAAGTLTIAADAGTLVCEGELIEGGVSCQQVAVIDAPLSLEVGSLPVWIEPAGASLSTLSLSLDCD